MAEGNVSGVDLGIDYHPVSTAGGQASGLLKRLTTPLRGSSYTQDRLRNLSMPYARREYRAAVAIGPAWTGVAMPTLVADNDNMVDLVTQGQLRINTPGVYFIWAEAVWANATLAGERLLGIDYQEYGAAAGSPHVPGHAAGAVGSQIGRSHIASAADHIFDTHQQVSTVFYLKSGDLIAPHLFFNNAATQNLTTGGSTEFSLAFAAGMISTGMSG